MRPAAPGGLRSLAFSLFLIDRQAPPDTPLSKIGRGASRACRENSMLSLAASLADARGGPWSWAPTASTAAAIGLRPLPARSEARPGWGRRRHGGEGIRSWPLVELDKAIVRLALAQDPMG